MDNNSLENSAESLAVRKQKIIKAVEDKKLEIETNVSQKNFIEKIIEQFRKFRHESDVSGKHSVNEKNDTLSEDLSKQLKAVEIKLAAISVKNSRIVAENIVSTHLVAGMTVSLLPFPLLDITSLTATQLNLLRTLTKHYGVDFNEKKSKVILTSLLSGSFPVLTVLSLSSLSKAIPGFGTLGGGISMSVLSGAVIYGTGQVFISHFEAGGTIDNFESKHWHAYFKKQVEEGRLLMNKKSDISDPR